MNVELLYFDGCPQHEPVLDRLRGLIEQVAPSATLELVRISSEEQARAERFLGSPSVRVDGRDVEPGADERRDYAVTCRLYPTPDGLMGMPRDEWLATALRDDRGGR